MHQEIQTLHIGEACNRLSELIHLLDDAKDVDALLRGLTGRLRRWTGCEAVGIRFREGLDYPYYETSGFPQRFVRLENSLCSKNDDGSPKLDEKGQPVLECMCGNVLQGRFDPSLPNYTERGSFWRNSSPLRLSAPAAGVSQAALRNRCHNEGYESMALVALSCNAQTFGLLQFNDTRPDRFTPDLLTFLECAADNVAQAISRRFAEERLTQSERSYRSMFDTGNAIKLLIDPQSGGILDVNTAAVDFYGYTKDALLGMHISRINTLEPPQLRQAMDKALHQELGTFSFMHRLANGEQRAVESHVCPVIFEGRQALFSIVHDVSERQSHLAALAKQRALLERMINNAPIIIGLVEGPEHRFVLANPMLETLVPPSRRPVVGCPFSQLFPKMARSGARALDSVYRTGTRVLVRERKVVSAGSTTWWDVAFVPLNGLDGRVEQVLILAGDVTVRKQAELALVAAKEAAESSDRAKSEFLANMSHEIRTPLNGILGMLQLLNESNDEVERREFQEMAYSSGTRLLGLLGDILNFSSMESDCGCLRTGPLSLSGTLEAVQGLFSLTCRQKGLDFVTRLERGGPDHLLGDDARIRQVLFNLVGNAVKFTSTGHITLDMWVRPGPFEHEAKLYILVEDTGVGIPDHMLAHIFDRFTQVNASYNREFQGAGLGLAIVKRIVGLMGGEIAVDSEEGVGTRIGVCLPLNRQETVLANPDGTLCHRAKKKEAGLRVLVAEDDPINNLALRRIVERMGHRAVGVADGHLALAALRAEAFDCVFLDIQMPLISGLDVLHTVRNSPEFAAIASIYIIAMTAYAMQGDREMFLQRGMDDYIAKPAMIEDIQAALGKVVKKLEAERVGD